MRPGSVIPLIVVLFLSFLPSSAECFSYGPRIQTIVDAEGNTRQYRVRLHEHKMIDGQYVDVPWDDFIAHGRFHLILGEHNLSTGNLNDYISQRGYG